MKPTDIEKRLIEFAARVLDMTEAVPKTVTAKHLTGQIIHSATPPALNYDEVQTSESTTDFIHKMKICLKELRETMICLKIIETRGWFGQGKLTALLQENNELIAIFVASAKTAGLKSKIADVKPG